jgi:hypothetical protein
MVCGLAMIAVRPAACAPRAVVEGQVHDAGRVVVGGRVEHTFTIRNAGDAPLALGPTSAPPEAAVSCDAVVAPGKPGRVRVTIDTLGMGGSTTTTVHVPTNDPAHARIDLDLRLDVYPLIAVVPGKARFISVRGADPVTVAQTLHAMDDVPFRVREVVSTVPGVVVERPEGGEPRVEWTIGLTLRGDAPVGALAGVVELRTDHPKQSRLGIPVSGFVRPVVAVTPPRLDLRDAARPWRATLQVRSFADAPIELRKATTDVPGVTLTIRTLTPGSLYAVDLQSEGNTTPGTVRLETSSDIDPVIEIPLRAN